MKNAETQFGTKEQAIPLDRKEHMYHQETVRVAILRMNADDLTHDLFPSAHTIDNVIHTYAGASPETLEALLLGKAGPLPEITRMVWEAKATGRQVVNPNQIILVGGGGTPRDPSVPRTSNSILKAAREESFQEVHLVAHKAALVNGAQYTYSFPHPRLPDTHKPGRLINTSYLVRAQAAPHDEVQFYDPQDKLQEVIELTPRGVTRLLETETLTIDDGRTFTLVDSLLTQPTQKTHGRVMVEELQAMQFREAIESEGYIYEASSMRRVIANLERVPGNEIKGHERRQIERYLRSPQATDKSTALADLETARSILKNIEKSYSDKTKTPVRYISEESYQKLLGAGVSENRLKRRMKLVDTLSTAARWTEEELTVECYVQTGPQFPLLLSHLLSEHAEWTQHDYELISRSPVFKHIVDTACRVFAVDPLSNPSWHKHVREKLQAFRKKELTHPQEYTATRTDLMEAFCVPRDLRVPAIGNSVKLGLLSEKVETFLRRQLGPLSRVADDGTLMRLRHKALGSTTSEIPELLMRMFGVDQYDGSPVEQSEQNAAARKLIEMIRINQVETRRIPKLSAQIKPLREAANTLLGERVGLVKTSTGVFEQYDVSASVIDRYKDRVAAGNSVIEGIDVSAYPISVAFSVRVKDEFSEYRKDLERGGIDPIEEELSDMFGFMMGLNQHEFQKAIRHDYPLLPAHSVTRVVEHWKRWASQFLLESIILRELETHADDNPTFRLYKGRSAGPGMTGIMQDLKIEPQETGSASSEAKWEWIKYVLEMTDQNGDIYRVEIQLFPSIEDMVKKRRDDEDYDLKRLFLHAEGRYPLVRVLFGMQGAYGDVMRGFYEKRQTQNRRRRSWRKHIKNLVLQWIQKELEKEQIIYTYRS